VERFKILDYGSKTTKQVSDSDSLLISTEFETFQQTSQTIS
jgi:hypothetical protein